MALFMRLQNCEKRLLITSYLSVRLSFCPPLSPHATTQLPLEGLPENFILSIFRRSVEKIQVLLKYGNRNGYFTCRPIDIFRHISLSYSTRWVKSRYRVYIYIYI